MRRWLFNLLATISLILCILTIAAWSLRKSGTDEWTWTTETLPLPADGDMPFRSRTWQLTFGGGAVRLNLLTISRGTQRSKVWLTPMMSTFKHTVGLPDFSPSVMLPPRFGGSSKIFLLIGDFAIADSEARLGTEYLWYPAARFPLWFVALLFSILPLCWEIRYRRWLAADKRTRRGFCAGCGYDLRATPLRCPECGAVVKKTRRWPWNVDYFWK